MRWSGHESGMELVDCIIQAEDGVEQMPMGVVPNHLSFPNPATGMSVFG
jgi:hypothetical protein